MVANGPDLTVWLVALPTELAAASHARLTSQEQARVAAMTSPGAALRFAGRRLAVSQIITSITGDAAPRFSLRCGACGSSEHGKPSVIGQPFSCSWSSGGRWVALAVAHGAEVGIDVEAPRTVRAGLARRICTPAERSWVTSADGAVDTDRLLRLWVRKEAALKQAGRGIESDLASVEVHRVPPAGFAQVPTPHGTVFVGDVETRCDAVVSCAVDVVVGPARLVATSLGTDGTVQLPAAEAIA